MSGVYKTTSFKRVIAQVYRDFKPSNSGWVSDAIEWIGAAVEIIGIHAGYEEKCTTFEVCDHRVKLPCSLEVILGVEYNGHRLQRSGAFNHRKSSSCCDGLPCHTTESYTLNPNYILTSFKEGCIKLYYQGIKTDCDGFPEVPDHPKVLEAISWYIMMKLCMRGMKHPVIDYPHALRMWEIHYPRAQNSGKFRDIDDYELFRKVWLGVAPPADLVNKFFNNELGYRNDALPPGSTFPNPLNS